MQNDGGMIFVALIVGFFIYFAPAIISSVRKHHNKNAIYALNLLLGWTFIGWLASLIWALTAIKSESQNIPSVQGR